MDDRTDEMMVEWFKLVRKRNEFLREESSLIYASVFSLCTVFRSLNLKIYDAVYNVHEYLIVRNM